jgi:hypothetical protein
VRLVHLLLVSLAFAPLATADQDLDAGPASVRTRNDAWGDGDCEEGADGGVTRQAEAKVALTAHDSVAAGAGQPCDTWTHNDYDYASNGGYAYVGRSMDNSGGPYLSAGWYDFTYVEPGQSARACSTNAYLSGPNVLLGCLPNGESWPTLPALP